MNPEFMLDFDRDDNTQENKDQGDQDDSLDSFTNSILSQYASGMNPPICKVSNAKSVSQTVKLPFGDSISANEQNRDVNSNDAFTFNNYLNKIEILYTMATKLENTWNELFNLVKERTNYNRYDLSLKKPSIWKNSNSINDLHLEAISRWIETSSNIMCCLANTLNIDNLNHVEFSGSKLLQDSIDESYSKFNTDITKSWGQTKNSNQIQENDLKNEYLKVMKFNTMIQSDYEKIIEKLRNERDAAISKAELKAVLEKEIYSLNERISLLERQLVDKNSQIEELNRSVESANRVQLQIMKKNEELIASNQKLLMDKNNFIDKDAAKQLIKQYYEEERRGGERKGDIVQLLERMLDINKKSKTSEELKSEHRRSLLSEFMNFVNENVESR
ncbi:hypothetical protein MACK_000096 [Theileria orientalis]|uniref:Uncharacterized protein n=1 Tax=Theileria orientalis TaxID=68886 RepID=A0A976M996_THEOR|nr:hypothetical protein MACK_000096 [Theileria orientalis]